MPFLDRLALCCGASIAISLLAACAQSASGSLPATGAMRQPATMEAKTAPPPCKGQQTSKKYATVEEQLQAGGGEACIPAFGGYGGKIGYPDLSPSIALTITTSTTNYNGMPALGNSGTPILYIQLAISGKTSFGQTIEHNGALEGAGIVPGQTYTAFGQASAFGIKEDLPPCFAIAKKSKFGGKFNGLGTLLKGQSIPTAATGVVEIYPGKQASEKC
ncbi:MAG TPA: hypothetical protein VGF18_09485 [Candidatus Tumulicola sp.]|jgi:hypothetical protein